MINTLSKINLSKIGWEGGGSTSVWIMSLNILGFFGDYPHQDNIYPIFGWGGEAVLNKVYVRVTYPHAHVHG